MLVSVLIKDLGLVLRRSYIEQVVCSEAFEGVTPSESARSSSSCSVTLIVSCQYLR